MDYSKGIKEMRGYVLSPKGLEKLENLIAQENNLSQEQIALEACLDRATVSKALQGEKPLNIRSIRRLFGGLKLPLEPTDYHKASTKELELSMGDREDLISAAEALEAEANEAEEKGNSGKANQLRAKAANLRRIAAQ